MGLLPRRLRHGEEATLVEHLGELRARLIIALGSISGTLGTPLALVVRNRSGLRSACSMADTKPT